jgi:TetR/AcrR family transcriptional regulator, regulator of autoinduction and epiphytic fitness
VPPPMSKPASQPRRYDASRRREQAQRTRAEILVAARRLFLDGGYAPTTMTAIAEEAGVSVETIYGAWGGKAGVVQALLTASIRGDEAAPPFEESEGIQAVIVESDPRRQFELYCSVLVGVQQRLAPLRRILREAAPSDPKLAATDAKHKSDRLAGVTRFAELLAARGALRADVDVERARDVLWTLNSSEVYDLLVTERGWAPGDYGRWIADSLTAALLEPVRP